VASTQAANLVANGDFATGDETGWTRWNAPWGGGGWSAAGGVGRLEYTGGSFGWYQAVTVTSGTSYTVTADWRANNIGWIELMFFNDDGRAIYDQMDAPGATSIIAKRDGYGNFPPNTFGWEPATNALLNPNTVTATGTTMYVVLKMGGFNGGQWAEFDNVSVTPEPASLLLLALPLALIRRR
jgi:hypothetical protein